MREEGLRDISSHATHTRNFYDFFFNSISTIRLIRMHNERAHTRIFVFERFKRRTKRFTQCERVIQRL